MTKPNVLSKPLESRRLNLLAAAVELEAAPGEGDAQKLRRFTMTAYTGGAMQLAGWRYPVVVDLAGLDTGRQRRPILLDHQRDVDFVLGQTDSVAVMNDQLIVAGHILGDSPKARQVIALADKGFAWQASIGARAEQVEFLPEGKTSQANGREFAGPVNIVRRATMGEISFVVLGADENTSAQIAATQEGADGDTPGPELADSHPATASAQAEVAAIRTAAAAEVQRIAAIRKLCAGQHADIEAKAIKQGWDLSKTELELLRASRPHGPYIAGGAPSDRYSTAQLLEAALALTRTPMHPERHYPPDLLQAAEDRFGRRLRIRQAIYLVAQANGYTGPPFIDSGNLRDALSYAWTVPLTLRASGASTLSLPNILSNLLNKELLEAYQEQDQTWRDIAVVRSVSDFKTVTSHRLLDNLEYEEVAPDGELKHGTVSEETYTRQARTYGRMFVLTRDKIIDDDLGAFDDIRTRLGAGAARKLNSVFWKTFLNNASFFTAALGNYITGADTALGDDGVGLQKGITAFRKLKSPDKKRVGGVPTILLVPPELQFVAQRLYQSTTVDPGSGGTLGTANIHAGRYRPVVADWLSDPEFAGSSAKAWYLFRDPGVLAPVVVSFLDGVQTPTVEAAEADFHTLGMQFRGYFDFGVDLAEPLAGIKSKGEA
jgi:hypothetical protein